MSNKVKMVSIDSSTKKTGMALYIDGKLSDYGLINLSKETCSTDERINIMGKKIIQVLNSWQPTIIYIEEPQGRGSNVSLVKKLAELIGFVRAWSVINDSYIEEVTPSVWRKYLGMQQGKKKREELKQMSMNHVKETYGIDVGDDVADAICIGSAMTNRYSKEINCEN